MFPKGIFIEKMIFKSKNRNIYTYEETKKNYVDHYLEELQFEEWFKQKYEFLCHI